MPDLKTSKPSPAESSPEAQLSGLLWEARADTGELTHFGGEVHSILGAYADLDKPRFSFEMFHPDDRERVATIIAKIVETGQPAVFDARIIGASPEPIWVRNAVRTEERDSVLHLRGVSFDITDLKKAQTDFIRARARLSFLAGVSRILAESLDYEKTLENIAKSAVPQIADWCAVRMLSEDGSMTRIADVHSDPSREAMLKDMIENYPPTEDFGPNKVVREGKSELLPDTAGLAKKVAIDKGHLDLLERIGFTSYMCVPMRIRGQVRGVISMAITDSGRHFTEADLEMAEMLAERATMVVENSKLYREARDELQRRETFIAQLGHELRNPLSAIANAVTLLAREPSQEPHLAKLRGILKRQTSQLSRLVNDLLDISRITRGKISLNRAPLDLGELATRSVQTLQETHGAEGRSIEVRTDRAALLIDADEARVEQIICNLLTNAIKFTDEGGHIEVALSREGDNAVLAVIDDGAGISPEQLRDIFKPFHQASLGAIDAGGMGLGLALVDQLTHLHGGKVSVSSDGPSAGSRFEVRLPLTHPVPARAAEVAEESAGSRRRVLIVDDNPDALESLKMLLELVGHEIEVAEDGCGAIERARLWRPEIALIDIGLPDIDGYEVVARMRALKLAPRPLFVALTGYGQPEDRQRALAAGFDVHLTKPVDIDELSRILNWKGPH